MKDKSLAVFENFEIRRIYDEESETGYFSVADIIQALIQQSDYQTSRKYWNKLKERLKKEGSQSVTNCHRLKQEGTATIPASGAAGRSTRSAAQGARENIFWRRAEGMIIHHGNHR